MTLEAQKKHHKKQLYLASFTLFVTILFVGGVSWKTGMAAQFLEKLQRSNTEESQDAAVLGTATQNLGTCPSTGVITEPPSGTTPLPWQSVPAGTTASLGAGKYLFLGDVTISGTLNITGHVQIYATNITVSQGAIINGDTTGNAGGAGGKLIKTGSNTYTGTLAGYGIGYCTNGNPGCAYDPVSNPNNGGGGRADWQSPDGAGGGGHGAAGGYGSNSSKSPGGTQNFSGANIGDYATRVGGSGGGGYCPNGGNQCRGGSGGGAISLFAFNTLTVAGDVHANGRAAPNVGQGDGTHQQAAGGGGAGGGILLSGVSVNVTNTAKLNANGGKGGDSCRTCASDDDAGGGGSGGSIEIFHASNGSYNFTPSVLNANGGIAGRQNTTPLPGAGAAGYIDSTVCTTSTTMCPNFHFGMDNNLAALTPGAQFFAAAVAQGHSLQGETIQITHQFDQYEDFPFSNPNNNIGMVFGDWWGVKYNAIKGHRYRMCFDARQGGAIPNEVVSSPATWANGAQTAVKFVAGTAEYNIISNFAPPAGTTYTRYNQQFTALWPTSDATQDVRIAFRTGSPVGAWFTGALDLDYVGIFDCGTAANPIACSCSRANIQNQSLNKIQNVSQNALFDTAPTNPLDPASVWYHSSAAFPLFPVSSAVGKTQGTQKYFQIQSRNWRPQTPVCNAGTRTCETTVAQLIDNADWTLYAISTIAANIPCNYNAFLHKGWATTSPHSCYAEASIAGTTPICSGLPTKADITGPVSVCAGQTATFRANVSAPDTSIGDIHNFAWSTAGSTSVGVPNPQAGPIAASPSNEREITTTFNVGSSPFTLNLNVSSSKPSIPASSDSLSVNVAACTDDPAEDIHASGRTSLNPPLAAEDSGGSILEWKEILGDITF